MIGHRVFSCHNIRVQGIVLEHLNLPLHIINRGYVLISSCIYDNENTMRGIVTLIECGRNGLQQCPFRLPRLRNPTH